MSRPYYTVINYADFGVETMRREALSLDEAYDKARETPRSVVEKLDAIGSVLWTKVFSPKHPCPSFPHDTLGPSDGEAREMERLRAERG